MLPLPCPGDFKLVRGDANTQAGSSVLQSHVRQDHHLNNCIFLFYILIFYYLRPDYFIIFIFRIVHPMNIINKPISGFHLVSVELISRKFVLILSSKFFLTVSIFSKVNSVYGPNIFETYSYYMLNPFLRKKAIDLNENDR